MRDLMRERIIHDQKLGARIRKALKAKGMTQRELGRRVGVIDSTLSHYLYGELHIQPDTLCRIADTLGVTVDSLMEDADEKEGNDGLHDAVK